ncbi:MAG TPA: PP2C family protein-serine/threonine phosphatase [Candidatus Kapabacteria bacterium]|nr:PP2C family protein-serine/threonine phosphatase [Candidatus Kapabacteria bacterium]
MFTEEDVAVQLSHERYALSSLLEFAGTLTPDLGPEGIIRSVLRTAMGKSLIAEAFAYLRMDDRYELVALAGFAKKDLPKQIDQTAFDRLITDLSEPYTAVPLVAADGEGFLGLLGLGPSINPRLSGESEATYLASLAALTSIALTNAWLFEREKERERLESELRLARDIQQSLLPQKLPRIPGAEFAALSRPSEWIGGDYYDVIELGEARVLLAVADVVGKGVTAALTMSNLQAALRALVALLREGHLSLLDVVKELNRLMCESTSPERFITAAFGVLDVEHRIIESVVCGHPNPVIASSTETTLLESTGIPLGIIPMFPYESRSYQLDAGSLLVFYTDGLSEAVNSGKPLGEKGTVNLIAKAGRSELGLEETLEAMVDSERISIEDDVTILAVRMA